MIEIKHHNSICEIVMTSPPVNAISEDFMQNFHSALDEVENHAPHVVLIRSTQKVFCAGADLKKIQTLFDDPDGVENMTIYVRKFHDLFNRIEQFPAITIAAINGAALGGGLELALSCDLRIAAHEARIGLPEAKMGMIPGAGGTQRLTRLCGPGIASRIILGCDVVDGAEALRLGIVEKSCPLDDLVQASLTWATEISTLAKPALLASKDCIAAYFNPAIDGYELELEKPRITMPSDEARTRIAAYFNR